MKYLAAVLCVAIGLLASAACAEAFKSPQECVSGKRVVDQQGRLGTVVKSVNDGMCEVQVDQSGQDEYFLFWMLTASGDTPLPAVSLATGTYECFADGQYTFMDIAVTGTTTYKTDAGAGNFHLESGNKLVFESGPFAGTAAKLDAGPSILVSTDGSFYGTSCELQK